MIPMEPPKIPGEKKNICTCCFWCSLTGASFHVVDGRKVMLHSKCVDPHAQWSGKRIIPPVVSIE